MKTIARPRRSLAIRSSGTRALSNCRISTRLRCFTHLSLPKIPSLFIYKGLRTIANSRKSTWNDTIIRKSWSRWTSAKCYFFYFVACLSAEAIWSWRIWLFASNWLSSNERSNVRNSRARTRYFGLGSLRYGLTGNQIWSLWNQKQS